MTSTDRPKVLTETLPRVRITPRMKRALEAVAAQHKTPYGGHTAVSQLVRSVLGQHLDEVSPGWDK